jgi:hypothetical protein
MLNLIKLSRETECPVCGAPASKPCKNRDGSLDRTSVHSHRMFAFVDAVAAAGRERDERGGGRPTSIYPFGPGEGWKE